MRARVIQGFFVGGRIRAAPGVLRAPPTPIQRAVAPGAERRAPGPPPLAQAARSGSAGVAAQPRMAPGRPAFAHAPARVAQPQGGGGTFDVDPARLGLARGGGAPLPEAVLAKMEAAFGADFSGIRVHVGPQAPRIGAVAFAMGNELYFAPGRYQPDTLHGQQLIGHELAHVLQQRQGRVRAPGTGIAVVQDAALEAEADRLGMRAAIQCASRAGAAAPMRDRHGLAAHGVMQAKGRLTTVNQATPHVDGQTYYCEISVDGANNVRGKNGKKSKLKMTPPNDAEDAQEWKRQQKAKIHQEHVGFFAKISAQFPTFTPRTGDDNNPHAEDDAIFQLVTKKKSKLKKGATLSVTISAAPCERCAKNLHALSQYFNMPIRIKATEITNDGRTGIQYLAQNQIPFRVWTDAQRDNSKRIWKKAGAKHSTAEIINEIKEALAVLKEKAEQDPKKQDSYERKKGFYDRVLAHGAKEEEWIELAERLGIVDAGKTWKEKGMSRSGGQWPVAPVVAPLDLSEVEDDDKGSNKRDRNEDKSPRKGGKKKKLKVTP